MFGSGNPRPSRIAWDWRLWRNRRSPSSWTRRAALSWAPSDPLGSWNNSYYVITENNRICIFLKGIIELKEVLKQSQETLKKLNFSTLTIERIILLTGCDKLFFLFASLRVAIQHQRWSGGETESSGTAKVIPVLTKKSFKTPWSSVL